MTHVLGQVRLFTALMGRKSGQQMQWRFRDVLLTLLTSELAALQVPAATRASTAQFIAGGFLEHLREALEAPGKTDPAAFAARFRKLALGVVKAELRP